MATGSKNMGIAYKSKQSNKHWPTFDSHAFSNNTGSMATETVLTNI